MTEKNNCNNRPCKYEKFVGRTEAILENMEKRMDGFDTQVKTLTEHTDVVAKLDTRMTVIETEKKTIIAVIGMGVAHVLTWVGLYFSFNHK